MHDWTKILLAPDAQVRDAIASLDATALQIVLVVDANRRLLGTVTDGDIRRGLLRCLPLEAPLASIMNSSPTMALPSDPINKVFATMKRRGIRSVPVVNDAGIVVGLQLLDALLEAEQKDNWVLLMAGGFGSRLKPLTDHVPKPLLPIGGKPLLETALASLVGHGFKRFYVSVYYKAEMIKSQLGDGARWGVEIKYLQEKRKMGTAGALSLLPEEPTKPVIVMNGDLLTKVNFSNLLDFHVASRAPATLCVREYNFQVPYGVVKVKNNRLVEICEKPIQKFFINAGIYVLSPEVFKMIPKSSSLDMPQLIESMTERGQKVTVFPIREYWRDVGRLTDLEQALGEYEVVFE